MALHQHPVDFDGEGLVGGTGKTYKNFKLQLKFSTFILPPQNK